MAVEKPKHSQEEVSQEFDLEKLLGKTPSDKQKEVFANLVIDKIVNRTMSGRDIDNERFVPYSPAYAEKKGVSRNSVDLVLTGDMIQAIKDEQQNNKIKIAIQGGVDAKKAYNHCVGDTLPKREFFGIKEKDMADILLSVENVGPSARVAEEPSTIDWAEVRAAVNKISLDFGDLDGDN